MLTPVAGPLSATPAGTSVLFAGNCSQPWKLEPAEARQLLIDGAGSPAYDAAAWVAMFGIPTTLHKINKPALFIQGTADPLTTQHLAVRRADSGRPVAQVFLARSACRSPTTRRLSWAHAGLPQAGVGYRVRRLMGGVPARRP